MKRLIASLLTVAALIFIMCSCNYQVVDLNYTFDYAIISYGDGTTKKVEIKSWRDYEEGEQIQITAKDGTVYLVNSMNCVLVKEAK